MLFKQLPALADTHAKLTAAISSNRIGHAMTFMGEEGSAALPFALATIQFMLCENPSGSDSCDTCPPCLKNKKLIHPDVHYYFPTATSADVPKQAVSQKYMTSWRSAIQENAFLTLSDWLEHMGAAKKEAIIPSDEALQITKDLSLKSYESKFRFAVIWLPERLNISAANKLLKIIEEPPSNVFFLLITAKAEAILPTVLSRTQIIRIGKASDIELRNWLQTNGEIPDEEALDRAIQLADGNPYKAMKALQHDLIDLNQTEDFMQWARLCYEAYKKMPGLLDWSDQMAGKSRDDQKSFLLYALRFFRAGILKNNESADLALTVGQEGEHVSKFAPFLTSENRNQLTAVFDNAFYHLERYANARILFMQLSIQFARLINTKNVTL